MKIQTRDFGEVEVCEEELLTFPAGIFAFEDCRRFALLSPLGEDAYPKWLQSAEASAPCFIVFDPAIVESDYKVSLEDKDSRMLKIEGELSDNEDIALLVIAIVPDDFMKTAVNLKAPIVVNTRERLAVQVIQPYDYDFRRPLYPDCGENVPADEAGAD